MNKDKNACEINDYNSETKLGAIKKTSSNKIQKHSRVSTKHNNTNEKSRAKLESKLISNSGSEKMPEITFNVLKEVPTSLISEEEKNKIVQETSSAVETQEK